MKIEFFNKDGTWLTVDSRMVRLSKRRRKISAWAECYKNTVNMDREKEKEYDGIFVTLTYVDNSNFEKGDISKYIKRIKERLKERLIAYAWVMEMQEREVPHYHIIFIVKTKTRIKKPDKKDWKKGSSNIQKAKKGAYYLVSYLKKEDEKTQVFPPGSRIYAVYSRDKEINKKVRINTLPIWLQEILVERGVEVITMKKSYNSGSWIINDEYYESPWSMRYEQGFRACIK